MTKAVTRYLRANTDGLYIRINPLLKRKCKSLGVKMAEIARTALVTEVQKKIEAESGVPAPKRRIRNDSAHYSSR